MDMKELIQKQLNRVHTENGDVAYQTTGSACLDYFSLIGGMRYNLQDATTLMIRAYYEDNITFLKLLIYTRDIYHGLGERRLFRYLYQLLSLINSEHALKLIPIVKDYGRYDDLLSIMDTSLEKEVAKYYTEQLLLDIESKSNGGSYSLLAKWLPSINTSNRETRYYALKLMKLMNMDKWTYRKILVELRENIIIENHLREKKPILDYNHVSKQAMFKNFNALLDQDYDGVMNHITQKKSKETNNLYPYQIVHKIMQNPNVSQEERLMLESFWSNYPKHQMDSKTLVVRDGSGSMYNQNELPIAIATSLAILFAESIQGTFHNSFITFSRKPELITLHSESIYDKIMETNSYGDIANTDIGKVYELLLDVAKSHKIQEDEMIKRLIIISDMEFDQCISGINSYEYYKAQFEDLGYTLPIIVFWNVAARHIHVPVTHELGNKVIFVSGMNQKIIEKIIKNEIVSPYEFMMETLKKYEVIDTLV